MTHLDAFQAQRDLIDSIGENQAHLIWTMGIYLEENDFDDLASECLTDGADDKKIDFIKLDQDRSTIYMAQGYFSATQKKEAPANKASDLNTAAAWLVSGPIQEVPEALRPAIEECRAALKDGSAASVELLYVHNLPESVNVNKELRVAASHLKKALEAEPEVTVVAREFGFETVERLYTSRQSAIEVDAVEECPSKIEYVVEGPKWRAGVLTLPGSWLQGLYKRHGEKLFSANYRGFLGSTRRKINQGIRASAEKRPSDFWVYNNGVTLLTLRMEASGDHTRLSGVSIINGAQTTGSIAAVDPKRHDLGDVRVLARVIECSDEETISDIVRYNNTQNYITGWDVHSNSPEQKMIEEQFRELGYDYARKRRQRKPGQVIGIEEVAQPVLALQGRFTDAQMGKNRVFERKPLYQAAFENASARHLLFAFCLAKAIDERRTQLKQKSNEGDLVAVEQGQLESLRYFNFKPFFIAVVGRCLEAILGTPVDLRRVAFKTDAAKLENNSLPALIAAWDPVVTSMLALVCNQLGDNLHDVVRDTDSFEAIGKAVESMVYATRGNLPFDDLAKLVAPKG